MFQTTIGPVQEDGSTVYLRPETAQGIFLDFKTTLIFARKKPPFGIAQIGKSFRNEITPGNFIFRTLEFEQMEMEFFVPPDEARAVVRVLVPGAPELVHAARHQPRAPAPAPARRGGALALLDRHERRRVPVPDRLVRARGRRQPRQLRPHPARASSRGEKLEWKDPQTGKGYLPHVIEPAAGLGRTMLALLCEAYDEDEIGGEKRTVLRLHPSMAPIKVAVLPLLRKDGHPEKAREIYEELRKRMTRRVRRGRQHRQALPAPGRDRHAVRGHGRPPDARGRHGHAARPRHARPRNACRSRASASCLGACDESHVVASGGCSVRVCPPARRSPTTISTRAGSAATGARMEIDFTEDRRQWHEVMTEHERRAALWNYAMFFHGEDAVADDLAPFIDAAPREEQKYFLATQQVDEARHAIFFKRFMHEVVGRGDGIDRRAGCSAIRAGAHVGLPQDLRAAGRDHRRAAHATAAASRSRGR